MDVGTKRSQLDLRAGVGRYLYVRGANQALTVTFGGTGTGTVSVSPGNLSCAAPLPCVFVLATGTLVTLTATPIGTSSFGTWANCDSAASVNPCTLTLSGNRTVTASFN